VVRPGPPPPVVVVEPPASTAIPAPSLLAYQRAAATSADAFEDLLDREAVRSSETVPPVPAVSGLFTVRGPSE
jgi:hypothetical protein